jgi:hypothetical protein
VVLGQMPCCQQHQLGPQQQQQQRGSGTVGSGTVGSRSSRRSGHAASCLGTPCAVVVTGVQAHRACCSVVSVHSPPGAVPFSVLCTGGVLQTLPVKQ